MPRLPKKGTKRLLDRQCWPSDVALVTLPLRHDVELAQVVLGNFAKGLFALDHSVVDFSAESQVPILGDFLGPGETVVFRGGSVILASKKT